MYLDYWKLERTPFDAMPDSRSFYESEQHGRALAVLSFAAREAGEPAAVTGPVGCGKTLLLRALRRQLSPDTYHVAFVPEVGIQSTGLLRRVAYHLTHRLTAGTQDAIDVILETVTQSNGAARTVVVMLDDWPAKADGSMFDELRWLLNLDAENSRATVLLSTEEADAATRWPAWLRQRLFTAIAVAPFVPGEVGPYLEHRLRRAEHPTGKLFDESAVRAIAEWSNGVPRLINRLAHLSLQVASLKLVSRVDADVVRQAEKRLMKFTTAEQGVALAWAGA